MNDMAKILMLVFIYVLLALIAIRVGIIRDEIRMIRVILTEQTK